MTYLGFLFVALQQKGGEKGLNETSVGKSW